MRFFVILLAMFCGHANATDIVWSGLYRIEGNSIQNPALTNDGYLDKSYFLHHLILMPKITALDGVTLNGRVEIFNSLATADSQAGDYLGGTPHTGGSTGVAGTSVLAQNQQADTVRISSFYLKWATEFGALVVGRSPLHFGLGLSQNAGGGMFDHYLDTRDMVGYKVIAGNMAFFPIYGKIREGNLAGEDDINDFIFNLLYENPDTDLNLGLMYQVRVATKSGTSLGNGAAAGSPYGGAGATNDGGYDEKTLNLFVQRKVGQFHFGFESSFANGKTGVKTAGGKDVALDAYALVADLGYDSGLWDFGFKTGYVTGDDPGTTDKFEGYLADRNYDVATLLFNHPLGSYDVLGTKNFRTTIAAPANSQHDFADEEYLSNAFYIAPSAVWKFGEKWNANTRIVWAQTVRSQPVVSGDSSVGNPLGVEWDLGLNYQPHEQLTVELGAALLFPGDAFQGGQSNFGKDFCYGLSGKAAVRF